MNRNETAHGMGKEIPFENATVIQSETKPEQGTYLTAHNIELLKRVFPDEATYIKHVETLWVLRELAEKACKLPNRVCISYDRESPYFRIVELSNDLIGALNSKNISFGFNGNEVWHRKRGTL